MSKIYEFKKNGKYTVEVSEDFILIQPRGVINFLNKGTNSSKKIPLRSITGVDFKKAGLLAGFLQFLILGSQENKKGITGAVKDENTIMFSGKKEQAMADEIRMYVEEKMVELHKQVAVQQVVNKSVSEEILEAKKLYDDGVLTEEEFNSLKNKIINQSR